MLGGRLYVPPRLEGGWIRCPSGEAGWGYCARARVCITQFSSLILRNKSDLCQGNRCETLNLLPPHRGAGYRGVDDGHNTSSWGGAVLPGPDGKWHMWAAEMTEHCGIGAWVQNRQAYRPESQRLYSYS